MYPESAPIYHRITYGIFDIRKILLRYFALPRPDLWRNRWVESTSDSRNNGTGYALSDYLAHPWYVRPTLLRRYGPGAWVSRLLGYKVPGDDGDTYHPDGFTFAAVGPQAFRGKGGEEMAKTRARLRGAECGSCPFSVP